ncbi:MAG: alpha/beta hydrolase [Gammaproteobacteria bacterium]|nr:alpha/beta hydrolase [Gammaproteobacteria bacterium]|tara:strand:+ start:239 stop:1192 length:954 start_codon:yes stop_codon:yes gene_type:complete
MDRPDPPAPYQPPWWLKNGHVHTVFSSRARAHWIAKHTAPLQQSSERMILTTASGARLEAWVNAQVGKPTVVLIHGWLGHADSSYMLSAAASLSQAGYSVVRLNLRDHGETAHLNEALFHSARIDEVVDAVVQIKQSTDQNVGLLGFSLGGNFSLRVAKATGLHAIAVCPAMDPAATSLAIDDGLAIYRWFFLRKWRRALLAKQAAFPDIYDFGPAMQLNRVTSLTELFVREHTPYPNVADYFQRYTLTGPVLRDTPGTIVFAEDDPVIPPSGFEGLPDSLELVRVPRGGHCAFVTQPHKPTWVDHFAAARLAEVLS